MVKCWRTSLAQVAFRIHSNPPSGVGSVSVPPLRRKESCPAGRLSTIRLQTWFFPSSWITEIFLDSKLSKLSITGSDTIFPANFQTLKPQSLLTYKTALFLLLTLLPCMVPIKLESGMLHDHRVTCCGDRSQESKFGFRLERMYKEEYRSHGGYGEQQL